MVYAASMMSSLLNKVVEAKLGDSPANLPLAIFLTVVLLCCCCCCCLLLLGAGEREEHRGKSFKRNKTFADSSSEELEEDVGKKPNKSFSSAVQKASNNVKQIGKKFTAKKQQQEGSNLAEEASTPSSNKQSLLKEVSRTVKNVGQSMRVQAPNSRGTDQF